MALKRFDDDNIKDAQNRVSKIDDDLSLMRDASRKVGHLEEDVNADFRRRLTRIDNIADFWGGPEAVRYMVKSKDACQSELRTFRNRAESFRIDADDEIRSLCQRKETLEEDIKHIMRTGQTENEAVSDDQ